jgi:TetR/AcrR family transcriptional regulator
MIINNDKEENTEHNKQTAILHAAEEEFMEKGFDGAKTTAIAAKAGVTHAMLHYYYRTKANLFEQVFNEKISLMAQSIVSAFVEEDMPLCQKIQKMIENQFDFLNQNRDLPRFVVNELISKPERRELIIHKVKSMAKQILTRLQSEIDKHVEEGSFLPIRAIDLMVDIASINVFPFIALPIVMTIADSFYTTEDEFLMAKRTENVKVILNRILVNKSQKS